MTRGRSSMAENAANLEYAYAPRWGSVYKYDGEVCEAHGSRGVTAKTVASVTSPQAAAAYFKLIGIEKIYIHDGKHGGANWTVRTIQELEQM